MYCKTRALVLSLSLSLSLSAACDDVYACTSKLLLLRTCAQHQQGIQDACYNNNACYLRMHTYTPACLYGKNVCAAIRDSDAVRIL